MAQATESRGDRTRQQIIRAAAHQFAQRSYNEVGLDDVLADANLTKGAMYFYFRSKHALASALIEDHDIRQAAALAALLDRKLSALETLIEFSYLLATRDLTEDTARAALHLLETIGRAERLGAKLYRRWIQSLADLIERAIAEGDISVDEGDSQGAGRLLVSLYIGVRQTSDLDQPKQFLLDLGKAWALLLPALVSSDRVDYFRQFVMRRTVIAISTTSIPLESD